MYHASTNTITEEPTETETAIRALQAEADDAADYHMSAVCADALAGDETAVRTCLKVIAANVATAALRDYHEYHAAREAEELEHAGGES